MASDAHPPISMPARAAPLPAWMAAAAGALSLAAAMGIGRFSFTPMLPLMIHAGQLDLAAGGWLAAANYAGYLAGAMLAPRLRASAALTGAVALFLIALLTAAMAWPLPVAGWAALRFLSGMGSAVAFVATSVWCLSALERLGRPDWGGRVYAGVGAGIALAGGWCLFAAAGASAPGLWLQLGGLSLLMSVPMFLVVSRLRATRGHTAAAVRSPAAPVGPAPGHTAGLIACYGLMGFGYILPATFLPVLARAVVNDPAVFGLAWPLFGATAALSTLGVAGWVRRSSRLRVWALAQGLMGLGGLLPAVWLSGASVALSAGLVGGTFMVVTLAGVQEIRARAQGGDATPLVARMTIAFALGQIAGPMASSLLLHWPAFGERHGLSAVMLLGSVSMLSSAVWLWRRAPSRNRSS